MSDLSHEVIQNQDLPQEDENKELNQPVVAGLSDSDQQALLANPDQSPKAVEPKELDMSPNVGTPVGPGHMNSISSFDKIPEAKVDSNEAPLVPPTIPEEDSLSSRINRASALKDSAKPFVKGEHYEDAIRVYESAFYILKPTARDRLDPNFRKCLQLQNDILNNLSFCYSSLGNHQESISYAKRVLITDHENTKALYRVASGYKSIGDYMGAYEEIIKCKEAFKRQNPDKPIDANIQKLYISLKELCKDQIEENKKKEKAVYSKMMGAKPKEEEKTVEKPKERKKLPKTVILGLCLGPAVILAVVGVQIAKKRSIEAAKRHLPVILTAVGAILCLSYMRKHVRKSVLGLTFAAAVGLFVANARRKSNKL